MSICERKAGFECTWPYCDCPEDCSEEEPDFVDFEDDAEPTSRSIDRENAQSINRDNKRER